MFVVSNVTCSAKGKLRAGLLSFVNGPRVTSVSEGALLHPNGAFSRINESVLIPSQLATRRS